MRKMKIGFILSMLFIVMRITAYVEEPESNNNNADNEKGTEQGGDLTVDLASDPVSLDPHEANDGNSLYVMNAMYDTLVALDKELEVQPALAESFEQIEDTVWEAKIRED